MRARAAQAVAALMSAAVVVAGCGGTPSASRTVVVGVAADDTACTAAPAQVRELSDAINGLAEPVSRLAAAVGQR
ncbi:hypothetical protein ABZU25_20880 [Micromonospora sp. NPDC005215]|uniref:hypothetical protein n=1 Tax=Micromonospora sp. NPDC005215 TaxID=3157024 RepID=UPI0033B02D5F